MRKLILIAAATVVVQLAVLAEPEIKGTAPELTQYLSGLPKTVAVTGDAEVRVPAHRAVLNLRVVTENRSLQEALRQNKDVRSRLIIELKKEGITSDRIQASKFSSTPKYGMFSDKAKSYRVENVIRIVIEDEKEIQNASGAVDTFPEVQFGSVEFEYADKEQLKQQAIAKACDNANERAKVYEEKLGLKLTATKFGQGAVSMVNAAANNGQRNGYASESVYGGLSEDVSAFGELVYSAQVTVEYAVQSK